MPEYENLLACWHKLEHFSPASLPKGDNISELDEILPWNKDLEPLTEDKTYEHTIYLGVFKLNTVIDFVKEYFNDSTDEINISKEKICYASIKADINGKYITNSLGISTLPWALGMLESDKIDEKDWALQFRRLQSDVLIDIEHILENKLTIDSILEIEEIIVDALKWSLVPETKQFCKTDVRFIPKYNNEEKNNAELLNSFFVEDIEMIRENFTVSSSPNAFLNYLKGCLNNQRCRTNLSSDVNALKNSMTPDSYPDGCWPSNYSLSLMQQYAVNNIFNDLSDHPKGDILSVNGPPGTGKTTLLRDIVAAIVVERAKSLSYIDQPHEAFERIGELTTQSNFTCYIYAPNNSIKCHGIVVASSNNGAVENVSKELPLLDEVKPYDGNISYFQQVAQQCIDKNYWGLISAVMGNKENRGNLTTNLWFNQDETKQDLKQYLNNSGKSIEDWVSAKADFSNSLEYVHKEKVRLKKIKADYEKLLNYQNSYNHEYKKLEDLKKSLTKLKAKKIEDENELKSLQINHESLYTTFQSIIKSKPKFWIYIFNKTIRRQYKYTYAQAYQQYNDALLEYNQKLNEYKLLESKIRKLNNEIKDVSIKVEKLQSSCLKFEQLCKEAKMELKGNFADLDFWHNLDSKSTQVGCPWYSQELKRLNSELFISALRLNETFLLCANTISKRITSTLSAYFNYVKGDYTVSHDEAKAMWEMFFLTIPVISTTFASTHTMFKDLNKNEIPWLFIDEAGQAVPQAAAGAIWRSKRTVVVGDPLQIEPVVTIPNSITNNLREYFDLNEKVVSSELSVQSMADRMNPLGMYLGSDGEKKWVGIPLRVHRRCLNPMFKIANAIAYDNKMVQATTVPDHINITFQNDFINQSGKVEGRHWVKEQGDIVRELLIKELHNSKGLPNVYVITPFSEIAFNLRGNYARILYNEARKYIYNLKIEEIYKWLKKHIGTIHTFQGKQADAVIMCLGLDSNTKGAANWASSKPNLLNVALTRAKYRFVAIGDESIWFNVPYFKELKGIN
jgi:superfamily I DNA and/or RNA helicase